MDLISAQFKEGKESFPEMRRISNNKIGIQFDKSAYSFVITIPDDYPQTAPRIRYNNVPVDTPMTTYWLPIFTLKHLLDHLKIFAQNSTHEPVIFDHNKANSDFRSYPPETFATQEARQQFLLETFDLTKKSNQETIQASRKIESNKSEMETLTANILTKFENIQTRTGTEQFNTIQPLTDKNSIIAQYRNEAKRIQSDIDKIRNNLNYEDFDKNSNRILAMYQRKFLLLETAQMLNNRLDI